MWWVGEAFVMWIFDSIKQKTPLNRVTPEVAFGEVERSGQRVQVIIVDCELLHRKVDAGARDLTRV